MASAAIRSREEFRDTQRRAAIRQRRHDRLDHWLETLEARVKAPQPPLEAWPQAVLARRQALPQAVTAGLVAHAHGAALAPRTAACPQWVPTLAARGLQERT